MVKIIDFTFSTSFKDLHQFQILSSNNIDDSIILRNLGGKYKPSLYEWNDFYSMVLIIDEIIVKDMDLKTRSRIIDYQKLFKENIKGNSYCMRP